MILGSEPAQIRDRLPDPDIAPQHAMLTGDRHPLHHQRYEPRGTFVNQRRIERTRLANSTTIRMGNTEMVYHEKR